MCATDQTVLESNAAVNDACCHSACQNYFPLVPDAAERNSHARASGVSPGAMGEGGLFREAMAPREVRL